MSVVDEREPSLLSYEEVVAVKPTFTQQQLDFLVNQETLYINGDINGHLMLLKMYNQGDTAVKCFTREKFDEINANKRGETYLGPINKARKIVGGFWRSFFLASENFWDNDLLTRGAWEYRAKDYLDNAQIFEIVNWRRWNMDKDKEEKKKGYFNNRPGSFEKIHVALFNLAAERDVNRESVNPMNTDLYNITLKKKIEEINAIVDEVLSENDE
jgi:hypothetical protein